MGDRIVLTGPKADEAEAPGGPLFTFIGADMATASCFSANQHRAGASGCDAFAKSSRPTHGLQANSRVTWVIRAYVVPHQPSGDQQDPEKQNPPQGRALYRC